MSDAVFILIAIIGWFLGYTIMDTISDKIQDRRVRKIIAEYEKEFD